MSILWVEFVHHRSISCHVVKIKKFTMLFGFPLFTGLFQALLSSPTSCSCISFHTPLVHNFSHMESVYPQARPDKHQGVLQTPSFGEKDWLSWVNLECKILALRGYNFSILIFPGGTKASPSSNGRVVPSAGSLVYTGYVQIFESKIQDFFQTISKTTVYFPRLKVTK